MPVPEAEVTAFVSAPGAPEEQRQKYFASLPPGMLVTLLTRATTLNPDLPVFGPDFEARIGGATAPGTFPRATPVNGHPAHAPPSRPPPPLAPDLTNQHTPSNAHRPQKQTYVEDPRYPVPDGHPAHYVRPGQGLMRNLPPDSENVYYLVDDDRHQVFSHYHLSPSTKSANGGSGGPGLHGQVAEQNQVATEGMTVETEQAGPGA